MERRSFVHDIPLEELYVKMAAQTKEEKEKTTLLTQFAEKEESYRKVIQELRQKLSELGGLQESEEDPFVPVVEKILLEDGKPGQDYQP
ncbi:MAG: hypothetical protein NZM25_10725 [Leptospiraceae bacterium]|nr:hypothetical protein [Leptospiraceae bacterium]MDW8305902.1 hypothetical protein [Leptospiraceae bacterium]